MGARERATTPFDQRDQQMVFLPGQGNGPPVYGSAVVIYRVDCDGPSGDYRQSGVLEMVASMYVNSEVTGEYRPSQDGVPAGNF